MPPKRRRIVNPSAQPGLGRRYLNEKFSTLPSSSAELKKGHVLQLYISKAGRSVTETERQLRKHFSFEGFSFRNSLNAAIKRILRLTVKKLNKLTAPTEFAKFSAICDEGFDLFEAVDPEFTVPVVSPSMLDEKITFEQTDSGTMTRTPHSNLQGHSEPGSSARSRSCQGDPLTPQKDKMKVGELSGQLQTPRRCTNQSIQTQRESQVTDFPGHVDQVFQQLNYQRLRGQLCDCVIVVGNRHFKAHRAVLAACSTHFRALFSVAESNGGMNVIQLDSEVVTAEALSVLVDMMYTSTLMLEESNVMDVLLAASHLHLNSVVKACKHYLSTRTLHLSLPGKRYMHCSDQHAAGTASSSRLQHPFLQQYKVLPIKVKEEAEQEEQQQPQQMQVVVKSEPPSLPEAPYETSNITCQAEGSDQTEPVADKVEQRASLPIRRFHKRKQSLPLVSPGDQPKRRPRLSSAASEEPSWVRVVVETVGEEGEFFSPDSHRVADESKHDTDMAVEDDDGGRSGMPGELYRSQAAREDAQVSGRSDSGVVREQGLQEKEEYSDILQKCEVLIKVKEEVEEQQPQQMHVVVKSEAPDETNNVTSWAEGSDQAEPVAVKAEISPQSSVRSFSDTHSDTDCIPETHCSSGGGLVVLAWVSGATAELLPKCHWMGVPGSICAESSQIQDTISSSSSSSATICDALLNIPSYEGVGGH